VHTKGGFNTSQGTRVAVSTYCQLIPELMVSPWRPLARAREVVGIT
jgi:hypothetical protein